MVRDGPQLNRNKRNHCARDRLQRRPLFQPRNAFLQLKRWHTLQRRNRGPGCGSFGCRRRTAKLITRAEAGGKCQRQLFLGLHVDKRSCSKLMRRIGLLRICLALAAASAPRTMARTRSRTPTASLTRVSRAHSAGLPVQCISPPLMTYVCEDQRAAADVEPDRLLGGGAYEDSMGMVGHTYADLNIAPSDIPWTPSTDAAERSLDDPADSIAVQVLISHAGSACGHV